MSEHKCPHCDKVSTTSEGLEMHMRAKHSEHMLVKKKSMFTARGKKKIRNYILAAALVILLVWGYSAITNKKTLPPTTMQGHIESWPNSQVSTNPIPLNIFKHILEHNSDETRPGIVITYDCESFSCTIDLVQKLAAFTENNNYAYVAPFKNQKHMIVVTALNRQIKLDEYDEEAISRFVK
jgi:hypothetical protein